MTRRDLRTSESGWRSAPGRSPDPTAPWPKAERVGFWRRLLRLIGL